MPLKWIPPFSSPRENVPLILTLFRTKIVDSATVCSLLSSCSDWSNTSFLIPLHRGRELAWLPCLRPYFMTLICFVLKTEWKNDDHFKLTWNLSFYSLLFRLLILKRHPVQFVKWKLTIIICITCLTPQTLQLIPCSAAHIPL